MKENKKIVNEIKKRKITLNIIFKFIIFFFNFSVVLNQASASVNDIYINDTYINNTYINNTYINNTFINNCDYRCLICNEENEGGIEGSNNCLSCDNNKGYHFHPSIPYHCINESELPTPNYYVDPNNDKYTKCNLTCMTCNGPGDNDCESCDGENFFKVEFFEGQCLHYSNIPKDYYKIKQASNYHYKKCDISCLTCLGEENNCTECNIGGGYYPIENNKNGTCLHVDQIPFSYYLDPDNEIIKKCYQNCSSCKEGFNKTTNEMNCKTCIKGTYFQNSSSTNCIPKPEIGFYVKNYILFPCHNNCLTCRMGGDDDNNRCLSCIDSLYFDDEINTTCVDDQEGCDNGCAKCYKEEIDSNYNKISPDKRCKRCSFKKGYYPLEKYSLNQPYVSCYLYNNSPINFFYNNKTKTHNLCYRTCEKCYKSGNSTNHSCSICDYNFVFVENKPFNCYPKCNYYYYFNNLGQYKCTDSEECPDDFPYLIPIKSKCIDNCAKDQDYMFTFEQTCLNACPNDTNIQHSLLNGENIIECINETLDIKQCILNEEKIEIFNKEITEALLKDYANEYINYNSTQLYVKTYSFSLSGDKHLIVLYKSEKCMKEKVPGFSDINLNECIKKLKKMNAITDDIVVQIVYITKTVPTFNYYLYHPSDGNKLNTSICYEETLTVKVNIFENEEVNEELVKYFANLNINILDINDPFFTNICFLFEKDGKDVPLNDRIQLYYQNVSLCQEHCISGKVNLETYEVECFCSIYNTETKKVKDFASHLLNNSLTSEIFGFIMDSNVGILKCIKEAFTSKLIINNYGGLMMIGLFLIQTTTTIFFKFQSRELRNYILSIIYKLSFPHKKIKNKYSQNISDNEEKDKNQKSKMSMFLDYSSKELKSNQKTLIPKNPKETSSTSLNYIATIGRQKEKSKIFENESLQKKNKLEADNPKKLPYKSSTSKNNIYNTSKAGDNHGIILSSSQLNINNNQIKDKRKKYIELDMNNSSTKTNRLINPGNNIKEIKEKIEKELKEEIKRELEEEKRIKKICFVDCSSKKYNENEINEMDFEDAIIYDKRKFCNMFWYTLKQKQSIINTFCVKNSFKPFSIKLLLLIFIFSCYFVINGFFYNDEYVSNKLKSNEDKSVDDYFNDSIQRIIYTSLIGGLISFVIGMVFDVERKIQNEINKNKDNKILLRGEIIKIYKCNIKIVIIFIILQFIIMAFFIIYAFCFCYVYPNNVSDWFISSLLVIGIIQLLSFINSFLIALIKYISIKCQSQLCFAINKYLDENL